MSVFLLRSCTLFSASSFFCLIVFFRKEIKKRNALRKSSFLSFLFFPLSSRPPFFVFFFPSHFLLKLLCFFSPFYPFPEVISQESCFLVLSVGEELSLLSMWHRGRRGLGLLRESGGGGGVANYVAKRPIWFDFLYIYIYMSCLISIRVWPIDIKTTAMARVITFPAFCFFFLSPMSSLN